MYVRQQSYWELEFMYGDDTTGEVRIAFKHMHSGQAIELAVGVNDAKEFHKNLGSRIKQAETGEYP